MHGPPPRPRLRLVRGVIAEHRLILALALSFAIGAGALQTAFGRPWPLHFTTPFFTLAWLTFSSVYLAIHAVRNWQRFKQEWSRHRVLSAVLVASLVMPVQIAYQTLKQSIGPVIGFTWDARLSAIDKALHFGAPWRVFERWMTDGWLRTIDLYYVLWFLMLVGFAVWCCWSMHRALRQRAIVAWLILWITGTAGGWVFASAGPCYYADVVGSADADYAALIARLDAAAPTFARSNQQMLWNARQADVWGHFMGISAMPSMHVALAALCAMVAWRRSVPAGMLLWMYALVIQVGSVVLGWHYAIDGYAGVLLALASWMLAGRWTPDQGAGADARLMSRRT